MKRAIRKSDQKEFAIKIIKKKNMSDEEVKVIYDEVEILERVKHPNCVELFETSDNGNKMYMVMELLTGGELFTRIADQEFMNEKQSSQITAQILSALQYLGENDIVHRDLKPENLMFKNEDVDSPIIITDFGLASSRTDTDMNTACGILKKPLKIMYKHKLNLIFVCYYCY